MFEDYFASMFANWFRCDEEVKTVTWRGQPRRATYCEDCRTFEWLDDDPTAGPALPALGHAGPA